MAEKRFLLFAGDTYYPVGGAGDYRGAFETLGAAWAAALATREAAGGTYDWAHVAEWTPAGLVRLTWDGEVEPTS